MADLLDGVRLGPGVTIAVMGDVEAGRTTADPPAAVAAAPAASVDAGPKIEAMTPVTIAVMTAAVVLSCASVSVESFEIISDSVLGWIGRVAALLVVLGVTLALSLLAIPTDEDKDDDGKGAQPEALTRIPRSVRDSWPWRLALCVAVAWTAFLTYIWASAVISGTWPSDANDAALGAWASWLAFAFLWAGKTPLSLGG